MSKRKYHQNKIVQLQKLILSHSFWKDLITFSGSLELLTVPKTQNPLDSILFICLRFFRLIPPIENVGQLHWSLIFLAFLIPNRGYKFFFDEVGKIGPIPI